MNRPALFPVNASLHAVQLGAADVPALQRFFDTNPEYFLAANGRPPMADEAQQEFNDLPPAGMPYGRVWMLGFVAGSAADSKAAAVGELVGMATVVTDFIAPGVGHIGLFIIASAQHGSGLSLEAYGALEHWMRDAQGSQWLRLGVVKGNAKAERFWSRMGYAQVRERGPVTSGLQSNMLRVMVKPLHGAPNDLVDYLARVARDQPGAP